MDNNVHASFFIGGEMLRHQVFTVADLSHRYGVTRESIHNWRRAGWIEMKKDEFGHYEVPRSVVLETEDFARKFYKDRPEKDLIRLAYIKRQQLREIEMA
jgi:hypothetical protein